MLTALSQDARVIATPEAVAAALKACSAAGGAALPFIDDGFRCVLAAAAGGLVYRPARSVVGEGDKQVFQDFELTVDFPPASPYREAALLADAAIAEGARLLQPDPLPPEFHFNDLILQRYPPGSRGITPHRDHIRYRGLVAILVVSGDGCFALCEDRSGKGKREVAAAPGDLLLMRAPGFAGAPLRPFHCLAAITRERLSFGLRWDVSAAAR